MSREQAVAWVQAERLRRGWSQRKAAEGSGVSNQTWSAFEEGRAATPATVVAIANRLEMPALIDAWHDRPPWPPLDAELEAAAAELDAARARFERPGSGEDYAEARMAQTWFDHLWSANNLRTKASSSMEPPIRELLPLLEVRPRSEVVEWVGRIARETPQRRVQDALEARVATLEARVAELERRV